MRSGKRINLTTCAIPRPSTRMDCCNGRSCRPTSGTTPRLSGNNSWHRWRNGSLNAATALRLSCGDCKMKAVCRPLSPLPVPNSSAHWIPPLPPNAWSRPATGGREPTGTSFKTGQAPTAAILTGTARSWSKNG